MPDLLRRPRARVAPMSAPPATYTAAVERYLATWRPATSACAAYGTVPSTPGSTATTGNWKPSGTRSSPPASAPTGTPTPTSSLSAGPPELTHAHEGPGATGID